MHPVFGASMVGSQLLSDALGDDVYGRLTRAWRVLIAAQSARTEQA